MMGVDFGMLLILSLIFISYFNISEIGLCLTHAGICGVVVCKHKHNGLCSWWHDWTKGKLLVFWSRNYFKYYLRKE